MKSLNKIFIITALGLGLHVNNIHADPEIQLKIKQVIKHNVENCGGNVTNLKVLESLLLQIKLELLEILENAPDTTQYKTLKAAVKNLSPNSLLTNIAYLKIILGNIDTETKNMILQKIPQQYKPVFA